MFKRETRSLEKSTKVKRAESEKAKNGRKKGKFPIAVCRRGLAEIKFRASFLSVGCIKDSSGIRGALNQSEW